MNESARGVCARMFTVRPSLKKRNLDVATKHGDFGDERDVENTRAHTHMHACSYMYGYNRTALFSLSKARAHIGKPWLHSFFLKVDFSIF